MLGIILLSSCDFKDENKSTSTSDAKLVELDFWSFWGGGGRKKVIEDIINDFNNSQNKIKVTHKYQPWGDIWTKSLAAVSAGNPPDIIIQDINSVSQRAAAQQNTNLKGYMTEDIGSTFYPQLWETVLYEGEPYGIPFNTDTRVIFYNKKIFKEKGLTKSDIPKTWKEMEKIAKKLDIKKEDNFERIGFYPLWNIETDTWAINGDSGRGWFDDSGNVTINTAEKVETLEWIMDWKEYYGTETIEHYEAEFGSGVSDPFLSGLVAMRSDNINYFTNINESAPDDFEFGVFELPERKSGTGHWTWGGGFVVEIPYGAAHPKESYEFIKYLTSEKVQMKFGEKSFDIMANQNANINLVKGDSLSEDGKMIYKMADQAFSKTILTPVPLATPGFNTTLQAKIDDVLLKGKEPKKTLDEAQKIIEEMSKK
ncbi:ABC transporter substrate-binding protein [Vagococcus carniphilus]|uniref:ABC transporter substrate-binding protein n=1 Tax=Vagococcus carniphilus TaxID=218144 RepID=UPI00288D09C8|nr:ABC transporter substrate-binding protein [Vagococcus carniphilus]MDT2813717.1 ABC transporter substrate-binding protein [Vagococcus carniphilus]MDT2848737.1 ABC transporter substrate-binding protein [Vagococcus carniphilus]